MPADSQGTLYWRHNADVIMLALSNHQSHGCLLNRLFRRRSKKTSKFRVTGLCAGNSPGPVNSPHKGPLTRKMFPFDDVIMFRNQSIIWHGTDPTKPEISVSRIKRVNLNNNLPVLKFVMMTSWHGNTFRIPGPLWGESFGFGSLPSQRASNVGL